MEGARACDLLDADGSVRTALVKDSGGTNRENNRSFKGMLDQLEIAESSASGTPAYGFNNT